jgi:hypothetical protein
MVWAWIILGAVLVVALVISIVRRRQRKTPPQSQVPNGPK